MLTSLNIYRAFIYAVIFAMLNSAVYLPGKTQEVTSSYPVYLFFKYELIIFFLVIGNQN